ncbi:MAG: hypothetical protein ACJAYB_000316 [Psychromonas sp.]|jgi:hypothetical protein
MDKANDIVLLEKYHGNPIRGRHLASFLLERTGGK